MRAMSFPSLSELPRETVAVGAALVLLAVLFMFRRLWIALLGPVFVYESDRVARRGRTFAVRVVYVLALLLVIYLTYPRIEVMSLDPEFNHLSQVRLNDTLLDRYLESVPKVMERFAADFSHAFLIAQAVVVLLLTPVYVGGAISDEKENRFLDFLLATRMSGTEILLGKLGARLLNVFGVLLVALPVLAIVQVWGGIDLQWVVAGMVATALTALSVGCISLMYSVLSRRTFPAIFASYALVLLLALTLLASPLDFLSNPISFQIKLNDRLNALDDNALFMETTAFLLGKYAAVHGSAALIFFFVALWQLRRRADRGLFAWVGNVKVTVGREWTEDGVRAVRKYLRPHVTLPPVGDAPLLWKERHVGRTWFGKTFQDFGWIAFVLFGLVLPLAAYVTFDGNRDTVREFVAPPMRLLSVLGGVGLLLGLGFRLARSVSRKREQNTLVSLLTVPFSRRELLMAKWRGAVVRMRRYLIGLACTVAVSCFMADLPAVSWVVFPATLALHAVFAANLGLFLSVVSRSTMRAYVALATILLTLTAGIWTLEYLDRPDHVRYHNRSSSDEGKITILGLASDTLNPIQAWWRLLTVPGDKWGDYFNSRSTFRRDEGGAALFGRSGMTFLATLGIYGPASLLLWYASRWRFRRETGHA